MSTARYWTDERKAILKESYERGGWMAAKEAFPDKSKGAIQVAAHYFGYCGPTRRHSAAEAERDRKARAARRIEQRAARARAQAIAAKRRRYDLTVARIERIRGDVLALDPTFSPAKVVIEAAELKAMLAVRLEAAHVERRSAIGRPTLQPLPRGDAEFVRRRLSNFVIPELCRELAKPRAVIIRAIEVLAENEFALDALGKLRCDPNDAYGTAVDLKADAR